MAEVGLLAIYGIRRQHDTNLAADAAGALRLRPKAAPCPAELSW